MTASSTAQPAGSRALSVLLYSSDRSVRDTVRIGLGEHPADDVSIGSWTETATPAVTLTEAQSGNHDLIILDGESQPYGGMGICRQLKNEIYECPPVLVLTGRPNDGWLATWSLADAIVPRPLDAEHLTAAVVGLARR